MGLEVLDDVHISFSTTWQILVQLKHTTSVSAAGTPINLASLDDDLWKTMSNWAKVITDAKDGRDDEIDQLEFLKRTEFHLVSNKSKSSANLFLCKIEEFLNDKCRFFDVKDVVQSLRDGTTNATVQGHLDEVLNLKDSVCERFFRKLRFELGLDDIISRVKSSVRDKFIPTKDVDLVFDRLDSNIRADNYIRIKSGSKIVISYEDFMQRYEKIFVSARSKELRYEKYVPALPSNLTAQRFVKQLLHIGDVQASDLDSIADYTTERLRLIRHLRLWRLKGQVMADELIEFHTDVKNQWKNHYRHMFRPHKMPSNVLDAALDVLDALRNKKFSLAGQELSAEFSNGELYHLSETDIIGWHPGWESLK